MRNPLDCAWLRNLRFLAECFQKLRFLNNSIIKLADKHKNYIETIDGNIGAAGLTALYICYALTDNTFEHISVNDENELDYEDIPPDYYASAAIAGIDWTKNINKRIDFWKWYLSTAETLHNMPLNPVLPMPKKPREEIETTEHFQRKQTHRTTAVEDKIKKAIETAVNVLVERNIDWDEFKLEGCSIGGVRYYMSIIKDGKQKVIKSEIMDFRNGIADFIDEARCEMYKQFPNEGAWLYYKIFVNKKLNYEISFNYDDKNEIPSNFLAPEELLYEFKHYPRAKEYTPKWWQKVLGSRIKYGVRGLKTMSLRGASSTVS